ncbi:MAG: hypothetical protein RLY21_1551 [Planctomycetota bacterium]
MTRAWRIVLCAIACIVAAMQVGCGPEAVKIDRTSGLELEYMWSEASEQRTAYYRVTREGDFRSSGGLKARDRETTFRAPLSDADVARFVELVRATGYASRPDESGAGEPRSELTVREGRTRWSFTVLGGDASVDALRAWLAELSMRQFRDVIEAQPEAGPRTR